MKSKEDVFVSKALASVDKAARFQRVKQIIVTILAFSAALWIATRPSGPEMNVICTVLILVGLMLAICTAKILSLINKNTSAVLRAIADLDRPS